MTVDVNKLVSDHAALQYLQGVLAVDIGHRQARTDRDWYREVCVGLRMGRVDVKASILTPSVLAAIRNGASRLNCATHTVVMIAGETDGCRFVAAIYTPREAARVQFPRKAQNQ